MPLLPQLALLLVPAGPTADLVPDVGLDTALAAAAGAVIGLGATLLAVAFEVRRRHGSDDPTDLTGDGPVLPWRTAARLRLLALSEIARGRWGDQVVRRVAFAVTAAVAVGLVTGWPVGALLAGAATWALPRVWRPDAAGTADTDKLEAIAVWTEMLRDTLAAAAGLEQAVLATATAAPDAISEPVAALAARIRDGDRLEPALHGFADDLADPTADLVVAALVLAATRQARDLTGLLTTLAQSARDQVVLRLRVAASRARIRTNVRIILVTVTGMAVTLAVIDRGYLAAYDTAAGQLVLLLVGALFTVSLVWLNRIAAVPRPARILARPAPDPSDLTGSITSTGAPR